MENTILTNVTVSNATVTCTQLPSGFDKSSSLIVLTERAVYFTPESDTSQLNNVTATLLDQTDES